MVACLKASNYRSVASYLTIAKQEYCRRHLGTAALPEAIALTIKEATRSAKRGIGPAKHTVELPFLRLSELESVDLAPVEDEPAHPLPTLILACWFLLREIEIADLQRQHVTFREEGGALFVDMYLRVQKNDPEGTGCTRTHTCTCALTSRTLCPVHVAKFLHEQASAQCDGQGTGPFFPSKKGGLITKQGFVKQVHKVCEYLKVPTHAPNGAALITGHVARATGAVFLAQSGVDLWRIQLLGRWGSEAIKLYIKDAPVKAMTDIALEAFLAKDIRTVTRVSMDQLSATSHGKKQMLPTISDVELEESPLNDSGPRLPKEGDRLVINLKAEPLPKLHAKNDTLPGRTRCGWRFELSNAHTIIHTSSADEGTLCAQCFGLPRKRGQEVSSGSDDTSSEDSESS